MKKLLEIEFYKLKHHKLSRVLFTAYFLLLTSISLIVAIKFTIGNITVHLAEQGIFNFPYIWHFNTYVADVFTFFLAIIVVSMVTNEFRYRTVKQNLIDGLSKKEFVLSKFYFLVVLSLLATLFVFLITLILGYMYSDYTSPGIVFSEVYFLPAFFMKILGVFSFIMFLGFLFRRSAFSLAFFFIWIIIEAMIYGLFRWKIFDKKTADILITFFPYNALKNLLPEPFTRLSAAKQLGNQIGENFGNFEGIPVYHFLIVAVWIFVFVYLSYKILRNTDL